jgi:3-oxoacyl-[acyl-carrier protein] reductase
MVARLLDKRILVIGAATGIGRAVAVAALAEGAGVVIADRAEDAGRRTAAELGCQFLACDVSNEASMASLFDGAIAQLGGLDGLVNNAGLQRAGPLEASTVADWDSLMAVNARGVYLATRLAIPHLKAAGGGSIINTGSVAGRFGGFGGSAVYASAKAAVHSITRNAAREFAPDHIRVNVVAPGFIITPFHDKTPQSVKDTAAAQIPMQRLGTAEDCVGAYVFLASDSMSGYITGQIIDVNGGQLMP